MPEVIDFPSRSRPPSSDEQARRARDHDALIVRDAIRAGLPVEALRHISGEDLLLAASAAVTALDEARRRRLHEADFDERRTRGELGALDALWLGHEPPETGGAA